MDSCSYVCKKPPKGVAFAPPKSATEGYYLNGRDCMSKFSVVSILPWLVLYISWCLTQWEWGFLKPAGSPEPFAVTKQLMTSYSNMHEELVKLTTTRESCYMYYTCESSEWLSSNFCHHMHFCACWHSITKVLWSQTLALCVTFWLHKPTVTKHPMIS